MNNATNNTNMSTNTNNTITGTTASTNLENKKINLVATTLLGVEAITARECEKLGFDDIKVSDGKVFFSGDLFTICEANIWLRTAERVLINLGEFEANTFEELFQGVYNLDWESWLTIDAYFPVKAYSIKSTLASVPSIQSVTKAAIIKKLKACFSLADDYEFPENAGLYKIHLSLIKNHAILMLDTSGEGLHKRGYRKEANIAPIKETLAAAIIELSYWNPSKPLVDPTCGSGTFAIEAALIGKNIAPGLNRSFAAESWDVIPNENWVSVRELARNVIKADTSLSISASDIDYECICLAKNNAKIAGVADSIKFQKKDLLDFKPETDYGVVISNPPYGERLGEIKEAEILYKNMGRVFNKFKTWSYYIITSSENFEKLYGKPANKRRKLYNGMIKCNLYQYFGEKPPKKF